MVVLPRLIVLFAGAATLLACSGDVDDLATVGGTKVPPPTKCQAPFVVCGSNCVNLATDPDTCGDCGTKCADGRVCSHGTCATECSAPLFSCVGSCIDRDFDARHCGVCSNACKSGEFCIEGSCAAPGGSCKTPPTREVCDGVDNDCDKAVDEGCECVDTDERDCGTDVGECHPGVQRCAGGKWGACEGVADEPHVSPASDECDGKDNDCDGDIDEGCDCPFGGELDCGTQTGLCKPGVQRCKNGAWGRCEDADRDHPYVTPEPETCDGEDNDCDGDVDENCTCVNGTTQDCGTALGACHPGVQLCTRGKWGGCESSDGGPPYVAPAQEDCDGEDNDCDGDVDENCECTDGATADCGSDVGECKEGTLTCVAGRWGKCVGDIGPQSEICDNLDNDCDGDVDENCECRNGTTRGCQSGEGVCASGQQTCVQGSWGSCVPSQGPTSERCDGIDNDCDGRTDEDFALDAPCPSGGCPQRRSCSGDGLSAACLNDPRFYAPERCDGIDNDCNGQLDMISEGGSLRSICECATRTLGIGSAVSVPPHPNLCAPTQCTPDRARGVLIDGICWPSCQDPNDSGGDGWGFENGRSCIMPTNPRAVVAPPCDGIPIGMAMTYCLNCSGNTLPFAMCQSLPQYDLREFGRGERWLKVDYTYTALSAARVPINLWFHGGSGRKRLPLVRISDIPGRRTALLRVQDACFTPTTDFGSSCPGAGSSCTHCGTNEVCGAVTECGDYDLRQAWLQVAAEFCPPDIGIQSGTITVHSVDLVEPNCGM